VDGDVWLVTGAQGSGKSTIAELLARSAARGVHVRGGQFYRFVTSGWVHFDDADRAEARSLLELRYRLSAVVADEYAAAGFSTVVQDNIYGDDIAEWFRVLRARDRYLVVLDPAPDVVAARDGARRLTTGKVAYSEGYTPEQNVADVRGTPAAGLWVDSSAQSPEETLREILRRKEEARLEPGAWPTP
jgi:energy-coupling factor transporter ATP-binding protein EcfA2